ncbi:18079_t:CDS:2 [Entrophospora sp. SA101]|nr:18079_t:CDS:2 [Entrophospora sp. SA101]
MSQAQIVFKLARELSNQLVLTLQVLKVILAGFHKSKSVSDTIKSTSIKEKIIPNPEVDNSGRGRSGKGGYF